MSSVLELVKKYQHTIEKYPDDEKKLLRCIEKLDQLDVTVKHLEDTGVGRTVNALRKEPGPVGEASRALVKEWKYMVATEEKSDPEDYAEPTNHYNGNGDNDSPRYDQSPRHDYYRKEEDTNNKRKHEHDDDDENEDSYKRTRYLNNEESNDEEQSSNHDDQPVDNHDDESDISEYSEEDVRHLKTKAESPERYSTKKSENYSHSKNKEHKGKPKHSDDSKHYSKEKSDKNSSSSHNSGSDKRSTSKESKVDNKNSSQKHESKSEKSVSKSHKSDDSQRHSSSEKERSKKHKSSKEKSDSESRERSKHKSSHSHKDKDEKKSSDKKHKSSESKTKSSSSRESNSSGSRIKSSSSKSKSNKDESSKKDKSVVIEDVIENGIDCGSGASFAEALGMISPVKAKKKTVSSPISNNDLMPSALLSSKAKLAPLPPLEISALPEISPNYKPMPPPKLLPTSFFSDGDAMNAGISSKNQRTKVYSGNKIVGKVYTLYELCVQVLQTHIDSLEYTGGVPYEILKPVVDRATPEQLFVLENYNPYLMEDTQHLWKVHCQKRFRNKHREEMETWRDMYIRCQDEQEIKLRSLTANIRMAQEVKKAPVKQTKMAYVDSVVKPPRNILRKQAQHGTARTASASPAARVPALATAANVLTSGARAHLTPIGGSNAIFKPKKAPLMQKALQFMRGRKR